MLLFFIKVEGQQTVAGTYHDYFGEELQLKSDNTFKHNWRFDLASTWATGNWTLKNDTIYLTPIPVHDTVLYHNNESGTNLKRLVLSLFLWLGVIIILWTWVYEIRINDEKILQRSRLGKETSISWADVKNVTFDTLSLEVTITDGTKKIKCHQHSFGFELLLDKIKMKMNIDSQQLGIPGI